MSATRPSYDPALAAGGLAGELVRLEAQAGLSAAIEIGRLTELGLRDGMRILEAGSGPGFFTRELRAAFPASPIVALDPDARLQDHAASLGLADVTPVLGTIEASGLGKPEFDWIVSRYLFQHLADPGRAASASLELLAPGGRHSVIDVDDALWGLADPAMPGVREIAARQTVPQAACGGDRLIGRKLWRILVAAGYRDVRLDIAAANSDELGLAPFLPQMAPERMIAAIGPKALSLADIATLHAGFDAFRRHPDAQVLMTVFIATGTRP